MTDFIYRTETHYNPNRWTVTIRRDGKNEAEVTVVERDVPDENTQFGYGTDLALAHALGHALRAHAMHEENPWLLATVACLLEYLAVWGRGPEWNALYQAAKGIFAMLDKDNEGDLKPGEFAAWAKSLGITPPINAGHAGKE